MNVARPGVTAFVLTGGGSLGAVQVGMLQALHAGGVIPDMIVGASVGAINAALYAASPDADGLEALARLWRGLHRRNIFPLSLARTAWCAHRRQGPAMRNLTSGPVNH